MITFLREDALVWVEAVRRLFEPYCVRFVPAGELRREYARIQSLQVVCQPQWEEANGGMVNRLACWARTSRLTFIDQHSNVPTPLREDDRLWRLRLFRTDESPCLDLHMATSGNFGSVLAVRTGSPRFVRSLLAAAAKRSVFFWQGLAYSLSDGILIGENNWKPKDGSRPVAQFPQEQDFFDFCGHRFVPVTVR